MEHSIQAEYTFFSKCPHKLYQNRPYNGPENNLSKFKRIQILQNVFSDNNGIKLENDKNNRKNVPTLGKKTIQC